MGCSEGHQLYWSEARFTHRVGEKINISSTTASTWPMKKYSIFVVTAVVTFIFNSWKKYSTFDFSGLVLGTVDVQSKSQLSVISWSHPVVPTFKLNWNHHTNIMMWHSSEPDDRLDRWWEFTAAHEGTEGSLQDCIQDDASFSSESGTCGGSGPGRWPERLVLTR